MKSALKKAQVKREMNEIPNPASNLPDWLALKECRLILTRCDDEILEKGTGSKSAVEVEVGTKKRKGSEGQGPDIGQKGKVRKSEVNSKPLVKPNKDSKNLEEDPTLKSRLRRSESRHVSDPEVEEHKGYKCAICFRALRSESHLRTHMLTHTTSTGQERGRGLFRCKLCEIDYCFRSTYKIHLQSACHMHELKKTTGNYSGE
jgi:hypothetical protein